MSEFSISVDGVEQSFVAGSDGFSLYQDRKVIALRVNGTLRDLAYKVTAGDMIEAVTIDSEHGLAILRHSTAHVLAQAVQKSIRTQSLVLGHQLPMVFTMTLKSQKLLRPRI